LSVVTNLPAGLSNVVAIAAGNNFSLALRSDGTVAAWGTSSFGLTNVPAGATNIIAIAAGYQHALALRSDRTVITWGDGLSYSLTNIPPNATNVIAITAGYYYSLALRADGSYIGWGYDNAGNLSTYTGMTNMVSLRGGYIQTFGLRGDGRFYCFGSDTYGQTDVPTNLLTLSFVTTNGSVDVNQPGTNFISYTYTNMHGFAVTNTRTVLVVDRQPPVISLLGNNPLIHPINVAFTDPGATALDACGGSYAVTNSGTVTNTVLGSYVLKYTSTDSSGNSATNTRTVIVSAAPSVTGLGATIIGTNAATGSRDVRLAATVNPNGPASTVTFEYGLTTSYGASTAINLPARFGNTNLTVTIPVNFGATYHWRVSASHSVGSTTSADQVINIASPYLNGDANRDGIISPDELSAVYASYLPTSPFLTLTNVAGLGGTNVTFALANFTNENYKVEYTTDLTNWFPLGDASPRFEFNDTNAPAVPQRFYRLRAP
jgi:hypothetical protein